MLNEALHWLVVSEDKKVPVIIAFDLIQRSFSENPLLDQLTLEKYEVYCLRVMGGCLSVSCLGRGTKTVEIWVMKEYQVQSSWTKSIVMPTRDIPFSHFCIYFDDHFSPISICITKDGGIFGSNIAERLEKINDKGELLEELTYDGYEQIFCVNLQTAMCRESLLSIPSVIEETSEDEQ